MQTKQTAYLQNRNSNVKAFYGIFIIDYVLTIRLRDEKSILKSSASYRR